MLLNPLLDLLAPKKGEVYLDLTAGLGGHAGAVLERTKNPAKSVLVDRDATAIGHLKARFKSARIIHGDFLSAVESLAAEGFRADIVVMDLGVSSLQLEDSSRGFSFKQTGPIDMRMDPQTQATSAADYVNRLSQVELADIIYRYGGEGRSRAIAKAIVSQRPLSDTAALAEVISRAVGGRRGKTHPATRSFQALRIAVNDELKQLEDALPKTTSILSTGGRLGVISFHSLEDRLVKHFIRQSDELTPLTKKPLSGKDLDDSNPRARSAKLRVAIKKPYQNKSKFK